MDERQEAPSATPDSEGPHSIDDLAIDGDTRQVWQGEKLLKLTKIEYDLLLALVDSCGQICTPSESGGRRVGIRLAG